MKTKTYIFLFFIALSQFGFGQDFTKVKSDTTYNYRNKYVLNRIEIDSILNSVYLSEKTQKLLKEYKEKNLVRAYTRSLENEDIFLPENHINLVSILSSDLVQSEVKKDLLLKKINYDAKKVPFNPPFDRVFSNSTKMIDVNSKDLAVTEFIKEFNDEKFLNFSEMLMLFHRINKKGKFKRENLIVWRDEKVLKIKKAKIKKIDFLSQLSSTSLYGSRGRFGVLIISYDKK